MKHRTFECDQKAAEGEVEDLDPDPDHLHDHDREVAVVDDRLPTLHDDVDHDQDRKLKREIVPRRVSYFLTPFFG